MSTIKLRTCSNKDCNKSEDNKPKQQYATDKFKYCSGYCRLYAWRKSKSKMNR